MSKFLKNLQIYLLWLAWLVLTAHLIIPHDHHLAESVTGQEDLCPVSNTGTGHHPGFPVHCHAFNDLASEKATTFVLRDNTKDSNLSFSKFTDVFVFDLQAPPVTVLDFREPFPDSYLLELSLLRAPPFVI
ncbi:MAG: hypothetical protein WCS03_05845 [Bacteroidota bacterium]